MSGIRALEKLNFETPVKPASDLGPKGELKWIPLSQIVIDPAYQRDVGQSGKRNVRQIVENFRWSLFSPLVVSPRGDNRYAAIDGQHRAIGALTHAGIGEVPCWVINVSEEEEARAFAVINGQVTALNPLHVFRAKVVAGDRDARAVMDIAREAGVTIMSKPTGGAQLKHGETQSPGTIGECLARFGHDVTLTALNCVTKTGDNPTMLRSSIITAFCEVLAMAPKWRTDKRLSGAIKKATVKGLYRAALEMQAEKGGALRAHLVEGIKNAVAGALGKVAFVPLPSTPAEIARQRANEDGRTRAMRIKAGSAGGAKTKALQKERAARAAAAMQVFSPQSKASPSPANPKTVAPKQDTRALIDAAIKSGKVRKFESGASGNISDIADWLEYKGVKFERLQKFQYRYRGKIIDAQGLLKVADELRAKEGLSPLKIRQNA